MLRILFTLLSLCCVCISEETVTCLQVGESTCDVPVEKSTQKESNVGRTLIKISYSELNQDSKVIITDITYLFSQSDSHTQMREDSSATATRPVLFAAHCLIYSQQNLPPQTEDKTKVSENLRKKSTKINDYLTSQIFSIVE